MNKRRPQKYCRSLNSGASSLLGVWVLGFGISAIASDLSKFSGERVAASWFNSHTGETTRIAEFTAKKRHTFEPTSDGDWVLVLDGSVR